MAELNLDREGYAYPRIPFIGSPMARGTSSAKDQRFVNCYFEAIINPITKAVRLFLMRRPGLSKNIKPATTFPGRGFYIWPLNGKIYSCSNTRLYSGTTDLGVTLTTSTGQVSFAEIHPTAATQYLAVNDGVVLYLINAADAVTTVAFPTPNVGDLIYFDQYLFVLKSNGTLWNCNADDPTTWDVSKYITSQMMAGVGKGLARHGNYVIVFTDRSAQFFYDAANTTGSPLSNVEQAMSKIGCGAKDTISSEDNEVVWVGNSYQGGWTVWKLQGTSSIEEISTPTINRLLDAEGSDLSSAWGQCFRVDGHKFYMLQLVGANRTFVYQEDIQMWEEWTNAAGTGAFPITSLQQSGNKLLAQHTTDGWIYNVLPTQYQDWNTANNAYENILISATFGRLDFDTMKRKFCHRVDILGDIQTSACAVSLSYTDDDYITFSTARSFDMSQARNFGSAWGSFRRRAWKLTHQANTPLRLEGLELMVSLED